MSFNIDAGTADARTAPTGATSISSRMPLYAGMVPSGPIVFGAVGMSSSAAAPPPAYQPTIYPRLYAADGSTLVANLDAHFDLKWQDVLSDTGNGSFSIPTSDADAALITEGQIVRCYIGVDLLVYSFTVEQPVIQVVDSNEEAGQVLAVSGRGWLASLERAVIFPYRGAAADDRVFNFSSPDYDPIHWPTARVIAVQSAMTPPWVDTGSPAPLKWPDPTASWIWGQADNTQLGRCYFRATFHVPIRQKVVIACTADDQFTLFLNGAPLLADTRSAATWRAVYSTTQTLDPGDYVVGAVVENTTGVGGFLCSVFTPNAAGNVNVLLTHSNGVWLTLPYPTITPGFTAGQLFTILTREAQARNALLDVVLDFTPTQDSDGRPWPIIPTYTRAIGSTMLQLATDLAADQWWDVRMAPGARHVKAYTPGGHSLVTGATFAKDVNINDLSIELAAPITNRILVKYATGYVIAENVLSQGVHSVREAFQTSTADNAQDALEDGNRQIAIYKDGAPSIVVGFEPFPDTGVLPYVDYDLGDFVTAPNSAGAPVSVRVLSITAQEDDGGDPVYSLELNRRSLAPDERRLDLLRALSAATVGTIGTPTPVAITTPFQPSGGGSGTGGDPGGGGAPGPPDGSTCASPEYDNAFQTINPLPDAVIYFPAICDGTTLLDAVTLAPMRLGEQFSDFGLLTGDNRTIDSADGYTGFGRLFDGTLDAVGTAFAGDFSIVMDVQLSSTAHPPATIEAMLGIGNQIFIQGADDTGGWRPYWYIYDSGGLNILSGPLVTYDVKHSLAFVYDSADPELRIYLDGTLTDQTPELNTISVVDNSFVMDLTASASAARVAVFDRVLTHNEIEIIAGNAAIGILSDLLCWWNAADYPGSGDWPNQGAGDGSSHFELQFFGGTGDPTFNTDHFTFDGVDDTVAFLQLFNPPIADFPNQAMCVGIIVEQSAVHTNAAYFTLRSHTDPDGGSLQLGGFPAGTTASISDNTAGLNESRVASTTPATTGVRHLLMFSRDGAGNVSVIVDGNVTSTADGVTVSPLVGKPEFNVMARSASSSGASGAGSTFMAGDVYALFIAERELTGPEIAQIMTFYGV